MATININKSVFSHYPLDSDDAIWGKLIRLDFLKKSLLSENIVCFLEKGIIRKFYNDPNSELAQEISLDFYFSGDIFITDSDKQITYTSIDSGTLWYIKADEIRELFLQSEPCRVIQKFYLEKELRDKTKRELQLLKNSPYDLYHFLLKNHPKYIQSIPLKYLASYIGITPISLSRIRKRIN